MQKHHTYADKSEFRLELLLRRLIIVDQRKPGRATTTEGSTEAKGDNALLVGFVQFGQLFAQLGLADVGETGMDDIKDELPPGKESVGDEFACPESYCAVGLLKRWIIEYGSQIGLDE